MRMIEIMTGWNLADLDRFCSIEGIGEVGACRYLPDSGNSLNLHKDFIEGLVDDFFPDSQVGES